MNDFLTPLGDLYADVDPYWRDVVFLLRPSTGAGITSFVEDSRYRASVARAGDVYKVKDNMFPPDSWSAYFDGSGDRLYSTDSRFALGLNNFTIEFWIMYISGGSAYGRILAIGPNSTAGSIFINKNDTYPGYFIELGKSGGYDGVCGSITALPEHRWTHFALVREETATLRWRVYINGVLNSSSTAWPARNLTASALTIGANTASAEYFRGYLSEIRITNGIARYKSTFTPQRFCPVM